MSMAGANAAILAAQAAARRRREEEALAQYTPEDLAGGWEFKFLRSARSEFGHPDRLRAYLDEEAKAGWTLLEKFDNGRLRLKRPIAARANDGALGFDAYRTAVGTSELKLALIVVVSMLAVIGLVIGIVVAVKGP